MFCGISSICHAYRIFVLFFKLIIEIYNAIECETRIVLRNGRTNKKKFHCVVHCSLQLIIQMAQVLFFFFTKFIVSVVT